MRAVYSIPHYKLCVAPFFTTVQSRQPLSGRAHFMTIGTWKHPPNRDGVQWLCMHIWPAIRQQLPDAQLHIYGSHMSGAAQQYHKPVSWICWPYTASLHWAGSALPAPSCLLSRPPLCLLNSMNPSVVLFLQLRLIYCPQCTDRSAYNTVCLELLHAQTHWFYDGHLWAYSVQTCCHLLLLHKLSYRIWSLPTASQIDNIVIA